VRAGRDAVLRCLCAAQSSLGSTESGPTKQHQATKRNGQAILYAALLPWVALILLAQKKKGQGSGLPLPLAALDCAVARPH